MPLLLSAVASAAGAVVSYLAYRYPHMPDRRALRPSRLPSGWGGRCDGTSISARCGAEERSEDRHGPRADARPRVVFVGGIGLGLLAYLVRTNSGLLGIDSSVAEWGADHATAWSTDALETLTHLGDTLTVIVLALVLVIA